MEHDVKSKTEGNQTKKVPQIEGNKGLQYFVENGHINIVSVTKSKLQINFQFTLKALGVFQPKCTVLLKQLQ